MPQFGKNSLLRDNVGFTRAAGGENTIVEEIDVVLTGLAGGAGIVIVVIGEFSGHDIDPGSLE